MKDLPSTVVRVSVPYEIHRQAEITAKLSNTKVSQEILKLVKIGASPKDTPQNSNELIEKISSIMDDKLSSYSIDNEALLMGYDGRLSNFLNSQNDYFKDLHKKQEKLGNDVFGMIQRANDIITSNSNNTTDDISKLTKIQAKYIPLIFIALILILFFIFVLTFMVS